MQESMAGTFVLGLFSTLDKIAPDKQLKLNKRKKYTDKFVANFQNI